MKIPKKYLVAMIFMGALSVVLYVSSCTHDDEIIDTTPITGVSDVELISSKVVAAPTIDGVIDGLWENSQKLVTEVSVPDPGNDVFAGYVGDAYQVTMRSVYDDNFIYFLAEWTDKSQDYNRQTWYFDLADGNWKQESRYPTFNDNGVKIREPFYEDKFAVLWNVNNTVEGWDVSTCWASCHTDVGEAGGFARHYTNPGETIDMWHWKSVRTEPNNQADDQFQDDTQPNGRHSDDKDSGGYTNNKQDLVVDGTTETVSVPLYVIPGRTYYYWITQDEIDSGVAKTITSIDGNGILYYDGGSINPNTNLAYQREGSTVGAMGIPSIYTTEFVGSRGDITTKAVYNGSGWVLEMQRALSTGDVAAQDINFSDLTDQPFGIGVFDNSAIAHAIKANLILKFKEN